MIALCIIGGVALFIALVLLIPVGVALRYDGEIALDARIAFVRLRLIPKPKKKIKLRKFTKKRFERTLAKKKKKEEKKAAKKAAKDQNKAPKESDEKKEEKVGAKDAGKKEADPKLVSDLWQMRSLIAKTIGGFVHRVRTNELKILVRIGSDNAATSALVYGAVSQFAAYVIELLRTQTRMRCREQIGVGVDFTSEKTEADIALCFTIRVGSALAAALGFIIGYIKHRIKKEQR